MVARRGRASDDTVPSDARPRSSAKSEPAPSKNASVSSTPRSRSLKVERDPGVLGDPLQVLHDEVLERDTIMHPATGPGVLKVARRVDLLDTGLGRRVSHALLDGPNLRGELLQVG